MGVCQKNNNVLPAIIIVGLLMASGCSGLVAKYGANSDEDGMMASEDGKAMGNAAMASRDSDSLEGGRYGGSVDGTNPYLHGKRGNSGESAGGASAGSGNKGVIPSSTSDMLAGVEGVSVPSVTNYGHNYDGVDEAGAHHGPVTGFEKGLAPGSNPDPETWANAYLGNNQNSREFYGDPSKGGASLRELHRDPSKGNSSVGGSPMEEVNPSEWAESYRREKGGPSPEYITPDMPIAHADEQQTRGSVGIGRTSVSEPLFESNMGATISNLSGNVQDIYFAFDSWSISRNAAEFLEEGAKWLQANPEKDLTIEGHCDQRGTQDYNMVLGQKRAEAAREYLINLGIQPQRIKIVSYGKERPFCQTHSEECFRENRRNHMVVRIN